MDRIDRITQEKQKIKECAEMLQPKNRWDIELTIEEFDLLCRIVMLESGGESTLGQQAVTEVILNRMLDDYYGGSLTHVLSAKGQFSTWSSRNSSRANPTTQVEESVRSVLDGETSILPFETVYFATRPANSRIQTQIGNHYFCNK